MTEAKTSPRINGSLIILLAILALAAGLRIYHLGAQGYWVDELLTMEDLNGQGHQDIFLPRNVLMEHPPSVADPRQEAAWWRIWDGMRQESHPPLYFILCRWWRDLFGTSESAIRSLSVIFSLASIALLYQAVLNVTSPSPALWAAMLMALATPQIAYAQEARNYSMLTAVSLLAAVCLVRIAKRGLSGPRWAALTLALLATALTHYFSFGVLIALAVYAVLSFRGKALVGVLGSFMAAAGLFVVVWGKNLLEQRRMLTHDYPMYANPAGHLQATLLRAAALPARHLIGLNFQQPVAIAAAIGLLAAAGLTIVFRRRDLLLWWLWLGGAIGTVMAIDLLRTAEQLTMVKYTLAASPAVFAIAAGCVPKRFWLARQIVPVALVALEVYFLPTAYRNWKGDWAGAAATVVQTTPPGDPVLIAGNGSGRPTLSWLYLGMNVYINPWPRPLAISDREPSEKLMQQLRKYSELTLVTDCANAKPEDIVPGFVAAGPPGVFPNVGIVWPMVKK